MPLSTHELPGIFCSAAMDACPSLDAGMPDQQGDRGQQMTWLVLARVWSHNWSDNAGKMQRKRP